MVQKYIDWLLHPDPHVINRRASIFNLISSTINSLMTALLLIFITRIEGLEIAGYFSIASAFAYQIVAIGNFGVRNFHATDVKREYKYNDYIYLRLFTSVVMYLLLAYYVFTAIDNSEKAMIILFFGVLKSIDVFEDVIHGEYQRNNRLDIAAFLQSIRLLIVVVMIAIMYIITSNLVVSLLISTITTTIILILQNIKIIKYYIYDRSTFSFFKFKKLFKSCLPLCICAFINLYLVNSPKYAIDNLLTVDQQSYYAILIMPTFTINLLSGVIYRPIITKSAEMWNNREVVLFRHFILKIIFIIIVITFFITFFGYILGLHLLEIVYGVKLGMYIKEFCLLLLGGGMNTLAVFFNVILVIIRKEKTMLISYSIALIASLLLATYLVSHFYLIGAALLYLIILSILSMCFAYVILINVK